MKQLVLLFVALGLIAAACSSDPAEPTNPSTDPTPTVTEAPATTAAASTAPADTQTTTPVSSQLQGLTYTEVTQANFPIWMEARAGDDDILLATRSGEIRVFPDGTAVLDLTGRTRTSGERGLLSIARHPDDDTRLFAYFTDEDGTSRVSEFTLDGLSADPASERVLLEVAQPAGNHNGGTLQFGPDGALYLGLGDGGGSGDRFGNGQNLETLLGGIVRIDPDSGEAELWQYGLRNPWRSWIDGDDIWIADVGQNTYEEINLADITTPDLNYGWPITEADHCYEAETCDTDGFTMPILEVDRSDGTCSITGGIVYRGDAIPEMEGRFFFSDYCAGYLRSIDSGGDVIDHTEDVGSLSAVVSFGSDGVGEIYVLTEDAVYRIDPVR